MKHYGKILPYALLLTAIFLFNLPPEEILTGPGTAFAQTPSQIQQLQNIMGSGEITPENAQKLKSMFESQTQSTGSPSQPGGAVQPPAIPQKVLEMACNKLQSGDLTNQHFDQICAIIQGGTVTADQILQSCGQVGPARISAQQLSDTCRLVWTKKMSVDEARESLYKSMTTQAAPYPQTAPYPQAAPSAQPSPYTQAAPYPAPAPYPQAAPYPQVAPYTPAPPYPMTTPPPVAAPAREVSELFAKNAVLAPELLPIFGHDLFERPPDLFAAPDTIPVPETYVIGPGDEVRIMTWGRLTEEHVLPVTKEGVIEFPRLGPIPVAGLTFADLEELIKKKAEAITGVNVNVTMGRLRTIQVFILGEVNNPGMYTVSSLATVINALLAAGGPQDIGTLRRVQLKRRGELIAEFDLYDFLMRGDILADRRLQTEDVIFVPQTGPMVGVSGNVKRPAIYEFKEGPTLQEALQFAGGLLPSAINQRIQIERFQENAKRIVLDIPYEAIGREHPVSLHDGDLVRVFSILPENMNAVYLYGNVRRPGEYAFRPGFRLIDLFPKRFDDLEKDASLDYAVLRRYQRNRMEYEIIPFDLGGLLRRPSPGNDLALEPLDEVYVFNKWMFTRQPKAEIQGSVRNPGSYTIEDMGIKDLIQKAGGLDFYASQGKAELIRTNPDFTLERTYFNVEQAMRDDPGQNLRVQDKDVVVIHSIWEYEERFTVSIRGQVDKPGTYPYANNMTVRDLLFIGGNVQRDSSLKKAEIYRFEIVEGELVRTRVLFFNVEAALAGDPQNNLALEPFDVINIRRIADYGQARTVTLNGQVMFPGEYNVTKDERLFSVIERAGGFTDMAYLNGATFSRQSVRAIQQKRLDEVTERLRGAIASASLQQSQQALSQEDILMSQQLLQAQTRLLNKLGGLQAQGRVIVHLVPLSEFRGSPSDVVLEDGDALTIPEQPQTVTVMGEVYNPTAIIYDPRHSKMKHYLELTGGATPDAEKGRMYLIRANGTVESKQQDTWLFSAMFMYGLKNKVMNPGDMIVVPPKFIYPNYLRDIKDITTIVFEMALATGVVAALL